MTPEAPPQQAAAPQAGSQPPTPKAERGIQIQIVKPEDLPPDLRQAFGAAPVGSAPSAAGPVAPGAQQLGPPPTLEGPPVGGAPGPAIPLGLGAQPGSFQAPSSLETAGLPKPTRAPSKTAPSTPPADLPAPKYATLIEAVKAGDAADVENHILRGESTEATDDKGMGALLLASSAGNLAVMEVLLDYGADPGRGGSAGMTPIIEAMKAGHYDASALLRAFGGGCRVHLYAAYGDVGGVRAALEADLAELMAYDALRRTPLHIAAMCGHADVVAFLMDLGGNPLLNDLEDNKPYFLAAEYNRAEVVKLMVSRGVDVDSTMRGGNTVMHRKARKGDTTLVDLLLSLGADINAKNNNGFTPLHVAAAENHKEIAAYLIEKGALIYAADKKGLTPLHVAAQNGHAEICSLLMDKGADVTRTDKSGAVPLHNAAREAQLAAVTLFLDRGTDVNVKDKQGDTALHMAVQEDRKPSPGMMDPNLYPLAPITQAKNRLAIVNLLVARGAALEAQTARGATPLHEAAKAGQDLLVGLLLDKGAQIDARDNNGRTALFDALENDQTPVAHMLIKRGANTNLKDNLGQIPLHAAAAGSHGDLVEALLLKGTDVNAADRDQWTPLHAAAQKGSLSVGQLLIANGAPVKAVDASGRTPLHVAAERGDVQWVKMLVANGADPGARDKSGRAPIHCAAWEAQWGPVQVLVGEGADVNAADANGYTPLHVAAEHGQARMVKLLLARGANAGLRNAAGKTALAIARELKKLQAVELLEPAEEGALTMALKSGDKETVKSLLEENKKLMEIRVDGLTPLHLAARNGQTEIVEALLAHGADIGAMEKTLDGMMPIHEASAGGHKEVVDLLLKKGANVNQMDRSGKTPLDWALSKGRQDMAALLREKGGTSNVTSTRPVGIAALFRASTDEIARLNALTQDVLAAAVMTNNVEEIKKVLDGNPLLVNIKIEGRSPLHLACSLGKIEVAAELIARGANIELVSDTEGTTPLQEAASKGYKDLAEMLLKKGADARAKDKNGKTALDLATETEHGDVAQILRPYTEAKQ